MQAVDTSLPLSLAVSFHPVASSAPPDSLVPALALAYLTAGVQATSPWTSASCSAVQLVRFEVAEGKRSDARAGTSEIPVFASGYGMVRGLIAFLVLVHVMFVSAPAPAPAPVTFLTEHWTEFVGSLSVAI
eukprot:28350-Hanusia_phi.AAC.1